MHDGCEKRLIYAVSSDHLVNTPLMAFHEAWESA